MKQKDYKLEIVNVLLNENLHLRALAKKLDVNPMTISRKIKELFKENILDYKTQGKNKVYFLKKNPESKSYVFMAEDFKLIQLLRKYPGLRNVIEKIQKNKKIQLAIIFGSYSKGLANNKSDVDIYIESVDGKLKKEIESISSKISVKIGRYDKSSLLIKEIEENHAIIKGVEKFYENYKFFE